MHNTNTKLQATQDISEAKRQAYQDWQQAATQERIKIAIDTYAAVEKAFYATHSDTLKCIYGEELTRLYDIIQDLQAIRKK